MIEVEVPDVGIVEFPDGMPHNEISNVIQAEFYGAPQMVGDTKKPSLGERIFGKKPGVITPSERGAADVRIQELMEQGQGAPIGPREGPQALKRGTAGIRDFLGEAAPLGVIPAIYERATGESFYPEGPETTGQQISRGLGRVGGFVVGAPGAVASKVSGKIAKAIGLQRMEKVAKSAWTRIPVYVAIEAMGLSAGFATAAISRALEQSTLMEALDVELKAAKEGALVGATFGGAKGALPLNTVKQRIIRIAAITTAMDLQQYAANPEAGLPVKDDRAVAKKVADYGMNVVFGWKGLGDAYLDRVETNIQKQLDTKVITDPRRLLETSLKEVSEEGQKMLPGPSETVKGQEGQALGEGFEMREPTVTRKGERKPDPEPDYQAVKQQERPPAFRWEKQGKGKKPIKVPLAEGEIITPEGTRIIPVRKDVTGQLGTMREPGSQKALPEARGLPVEPLQPAGEAKVAITEEAQTGKPFFTADAYHGTDVVFDDYSPETLGRFTQAPSAKEAFFFSSNPKNAELYAGLPLTKEAIAVHEKDMADVSNQINNAGADIRAQTAKNNAFKKQHNISPLEAGATKKELLEKGYHPDDISDIEAEVSRIPFEAQKEARRIYLESTKLHELYDSSVKEMRRLMELLSSSTSRTPGTEDFEGVSVKEEEYLSRERRPNIRKENIVLQNPMVIKSTSHTRNISFADTIKEAKKKGHDGVIFKGFRDPYDGDVYAVFDVSSIKPKGTTDAEAIRSDTGPAEVTGKVGQAGKGIRSEDLQLQAPEEPGVGKAQERKVKEPWEMTRQEYLEPEVPYYKNTMGWVQPWGKRTEDVLLSEGYVKDPSRKKIERYHVVSDIPLTSPDTFVGEKGKYLYHYTDAGRLPQIAKRGLIPSAEKIHGRSNPDKKYGYVYALRDTNPDLFDSGISRDAGGAVNGWGVLRFPESVSNKWQKDMEWGADSQDVMAVKTRNRILPQDVEISTEKGWIPVGDVKTEEIGEHELQVRKAIVAGKKVPPEVLADYPNLAKQTPVQIKKPSRAEQKKVEAEARKPVTEEPPPPKAKKTARKKKKETAEQLIKDEIKLVPSGPSLELLIPKEFRDKAKEIGKSIKDRSNRIFNHYLNWATEGKIDPRIRVKLEKEHGPQLLHWFRNMESILSQTKQGRSTYESARDFKKNTIQKFLEWQSEYNRAVHGMTDAQKLEMLNILDTTGNITGNTPTEKAAAKVRKLLDNSRQYLIDNGYNVGHIEGYLPHIFQGKFWVKEQGDMAHKVASFSEALKMADDIAKKTGKNVTIMQDTFIPPDDATVLSQKAYWNLVKKIRQEVGNAVPVSEAMTSKEVNDLLREGGVAKPKPRPRFFGNMQARIVNNPNFIKDLDKIMDLYFYGTSRKVHQDVFLRGVQKNIESMPQGDAKLKKFVEDTFLPQVLAHPTNTEEAIARLINDHKIFPWKGVTGPDVRRRLHQINLPQYVMDLGLSASSAVANSSQFFMNAYPIVGEMSALKGYKLGAKSFKNSAAFRELEHMGITSSISSMTGQPLMPKDILKQAKEMLTRKKGKFTGAMEATLLPFQTVELMNRFSTYWAGKDFALKSLRKGKSAEWLAKKIDTPKTSKLMDLAKEVDAGNGDKRAFARQFGFELNEKVNFRSGRENLPTILQATGLRVLSPYKGFLLNQMKYTADTYTPKNVVSDPMRALRFTGMTLALAGAAGNPIVHGLFKAVNAIYQAFGGEDLEYQMKVRNMGPLNWLQRGALGEIGADISGSIAVQIPQKAEDLLGRFGKLGLTVGKMAYETATMGRPTVMTERKALRLLEPSQLQRMIDAVHMVERGEYRTPITGTPIALKNPTMSAIQRALGMMPPEVARQFEKEEAIKEKLAKYKDISRDMTERWASAVQGNDTAGMDTVIKRAYKQLESASERIKDASESGNKAKLDDAMFDYMFWAGWMSERQKFKNALERKFTTRQQQLIKKTPKYGKAEAMK